MADQFAPEPIKGLKQHNAAAPSVTGDQVAVMGGIASALQPTLIEGNEVKQSLDLKGQTRVVQDIDTNRGLATNKTQRVSLATDDIVRVSATDTANLVNNPLFVKLTDGSLAVGTKENPVYVLNNGNPGDPKFTSDKTNATAAGASATISGTIIAAGKIGMLLQVVVSSSVRFKAVIEKNDNGTVTQVATIFGGACDTKKFKPADIDTFAVTGSATSRYQVVLTNLDNQFAADLYATLEWNEVTV